MALGYGVVVAIAISVEPGMKERWHFIIVRRSEFIVIRSGGVIVVGLRRFLIGCLGDRIVRNICLASYTRLEPPLGWVSYSLLKERPLAWGSLSWSASIA
jgi:hypothetical protein